jgi:hypothetical protein
MKKVITIGACVIALAMFSFFKNVQLTNLRKIGGNLYQVNTSSLKPADIAKLKTLISSQYGIKSFSAVTTVHYQPEKGTQKVGLAVAEEKVSSAFFSQALIENGEPEEVTQKGIYSLDNIPAVSGITSVLASYNAQ